MRSIWSGMINFGLVNIPVKLYTAVKSDHIHLNFLRKDDLCPISYKKVCRESGEEVPREDIVKGYEYQKGDYVVLDEEDFNKAGVEKTYSIDIEDFVDGKEIDFKYIDKPYYLEPDKKAGKTYALFRQALEQSGKVGIGRFVLRSKEHLVMLKPQEEVIVLNTMRFYQEILDFKKLDLPGKTAIPKNQMELALELINKLAGPFQPEKYRDTYRDRLKEIIEAKKEGLAPAVEAKRPRETEAKDILSKLKQSLETAGAG